MPDNSNKIIVINTSPLIALVAAWSTLEPLKNLYRSVKVPKEVSDEILQGGQTRFAVKEFKAADFLEVAEQPTNIAPYLINSLDKGEAAVIQTAIDQQIKTVCIDESFGIRIARLNDLALTGSIGILARYKLEIQSDFSLTQTVERMQSRGIRLGQSIIQFAQIQDKQ
jgi:predicted nucleic acid-binding protein